LSSTKDSAAKAGDILAARRVRFHNNRQSDPVVIYADGAIIRSAEGKVLVLHFYAGDFSIKDEVGYFQEDGSFAPAEIPEGELHYERNIQASIALTLEKAEFLRDRLDESIKNFRERAGSSIDPSR